MNVDIALGFLGLGEAGYHIARGLRQSGLKQIRAFDINTHTVGAGQKIRQRSSDAGVILLDSNEDLVAQSDIVISTVTADQARLAAQQSVPHLRPGQLYADLNSVSPGEKQAIAELIGPTGARFVEVAVMAPVPPYGHQVPMLAGGPFAAELIKTLTPFGIVASIASADIGAASAIKMCRSVIVKGLEALLTECLLAATYYKADDAVLASLAETFPGLNWAELATYMTGRVVVHGERRAREMEEVAQTLRAACVEPILAEAIVRRMQWAVELGLKERFGGEAPASYQELAEAVRESQ